MAIVFNNVILSEKSVKLSSAETGFENNVEDNDQVSKASIETVSNISHPEHHKTSLNIERSNDEDVLNERFKLEQEAKYQQIFDDKLEVEKEKIELAIKEGYEQGYSKGIEAAENEINQQLEVEMANQTSLYELFQDALDARLTGTEKMFQQIVLESIYKVFGDILQDKENVISVINNVIKKTRNSTILIIRVSTQDFESINLGHSSLIKDLNNPNIKIISDERVEMGGCIVETDVGTIDGRLETQLSHLKDIIKSREQ